MEANEGKNPMDLCLLGAQAVAQVAYAKLIQQLGRLERRHRLHQPQRPGRTVQLWGKPELPNGNHCLHDALLLWRGVHDGVADLAHHVQCGVG